LEIKDLCWLYAKKYIGKRTAMLLIIYDDCEIQYIYLTQESGMSVCLSVPFSKLNLLMVLSVVYTIVAIGAVEIQPNTHFKSYKAFTRPQLAKQGAIYG
jgi:hypothetical protein